MKTLHLYVAYAVPAGFGLLVLGSVYTYMRNREPADWYWNLLAVLQVVLGIQFVVGVYLFLAGGRPQSNGPNWLHYIYGAAFPLLVLAIAHTQARKRAGAEVLFFGVAAFLSTFSTLRALQTGLGID